MGFIGTGRQAAGANIPQFMALPEVQVVAVCDVDSWRLGQAREQMETYYARQSHGGDYKGCATFTDFRELLARTDIDTVMISTPDHWHVPMAVAMGVSENCVSSALDRPKKHSRTSRRKSRRPRPNWTTTYGWGLRPRCLTSKSASTRHTISRPGAAGCAILITATA